jgi:hypothetical protein
VALDRSWQVGRGTPWPTMFPSRMAGLATQPPIDAVIFDLDGILIDSEQVRGEVRQRLVREAGGNRTPAATRDMMGMSAPAWSGYMDDEVGVQRDARHPDRVVGRLLRTAAPYSVPARGPGVFCPPGTTHKSWGSSAVRGSPTATNERAHRPLVRRPEVSGPGSGRPRSRRGSRHRQDVLLCFLAIRRERLPQTHVHLT